MATENKVVIYQVEKHFDDRGEIFTIYPPKDGSFKRLFCEDKISVSDNNVLRGFHGDFVTGKLIACVNGACNLVYMSLNEGDNDYLKPQNIWLEGDGDKLTAVFLPKGYINAHYNPESINKYECYFYYKLTSPYNLQNQISIRWDSVGYDWGSINPILSERDKKSQTLQQYLESVNGKKN